MQPLAGSLFSSMEGIVGHVRRHFRILSVDSWFLGKVFKSIFFLGDENGLEKLGRNGFIFYSLTYLI